MPSISASSPASRMRPANHSRAAMSWAESVGRCTPDLKAPKAARVRKSDSTRSGLMVAIRSLEWSDNAQIERPGVIPAPIALASAGPSFQPRWALPTRFSPTDGSALQATSCQTAKPEATGVMVAETNSFESFVLPGNVRFRAAVAFYPPCRVAGEYPRSSSSVGAPRDRMPTYSRGQHP